MAMGNLIAIVGRPNVGKSTLFNRLTQRRDAIVDPTSGVTRDRHYGRSDWNGQEFSIIDTGGYISGSEDVFEEEIRRQVELAIDEATAILFLVDSQDGMHPTDKEIAQLLRPVKKPIYLVVNKVDGNKDQADAAEFYALGFDAFFPISANNGSGTGELLDQVIEEMPETSEEDEVNFPASQSSVGPMWANPVSSMHSRGRIGTSSRILRATRDSVHTRYRQFNHDFILVDTAGLRKKTGARTSNSTRTCAVFDPSSTAMSAFCSSTLNRVLKPKTSMCSTWPKRTTRGW